MGEARSWTIFFIFFYFYQAQQRQRKASSFVCLFCCPINVKQNGKPTKRIRARTCGASVALSICLGSKWQLQ